jgi:hypothetical protein
MKRVIEQTFVDEEQMRAEHHVEAPLREGQTRQRPSHITALQKARLVIRKEDLRRRPPVAFGRVGLARICATVRA